MILPKKSLKMIALGYHLCTCCGKGIDMTFGNISVAAAYCHLPYSLVSFHRDIFWKFLTSSWSKLCGVSFSTGTFIGKSRRTTGFVQPDVR